MYCRDVNCEKTALDGSRFCTQHRIENRCVICGDEGPVILNERRFCFQCVRLGRVYRDEPTIQLDYGLLEFQK